VVLKSVRVGSSDGSERPGRPRTILVAARLAVDDLTMRTPGTA
jgi:hypothetical protein